MRFDRPEPAKMNLPTLARKRILDRENGLDSPKPGKIVESVFTEL